MRNRKTIVVGMFLSVALLFGVMALTAQAGIAVDDTAKTITLTGGTYNLSSIWADGNVDDDKLENHTGGKWTLNYSIIVGGNSTLELDPTVYNPGCSGAYWLRLSNLNESGKLNARINVSGGTLYVNGTMITGWNATSDQNESVWYSDAEHDIFRPYIYIHNATDSASIAKAYFLNATIGYLGYDVDNAYGIVYEDSAVNEPYGWMHNCTVMENFQGITFQGCENMNVTSTWFNHTKEVGIVYTTGGDTGAGSHGGYIGDNLNASILCPIPTHDSVAVDYCSGDLTAMGIHLHQSDNITMDEVNIQDANTSGLWVEYCDNLDADNVTCYLNTNAADHYNIYLTHSGNCTFDNCTAFSPQGDANGGNWKLSGTGTNLNTFTSCWGYNAATLEDFYIGTGVHNNTFTRCIANNSDVGFLGVGDRDNTFTNCIAHNHTYDYKLGISQYDTITNGYANDSTVGVWIVDGADYNTVTGLDVNRATSYAIQIGTADDTCHDNTIESVVVVGKPTNGYGIFIFGNCTNNYVGNSTVTSCRHDGIGIEDYAYNNTFYNCNSSNNVETGFSIVDNANNNTIDNCTAYGNSIGMATRAPINYFHYCDITDNTVYGVTVTVSGVAEFLKCVSWNPSATYDWVFTNGTTVDVYGDYILGRNRTVNNQSGVSTSYRGWVDHDSGDGDWNLDTYEMGVWATDTSDNIWVNLTHWQTNYRRWYGTASDLSSSLIRQYCGGLTAGLTYDLLVDYALYGTYPAYAGTVIGTTAGIVWFNYTGAWSTHLFEIMLHSEEEPPGPDGNGVADENDIEVYVLTNTMTPIPNATVQIYENSVLIATGYTDEDGLYETTLDDGTYRFTASADGYVEEYQIKAITADTTIAFHLDPCGYCPAVFAGPYIGLSVLGWIVAIVLVIIGFILAYLIDSRQIKKDYLALILVPNAILVILGLLCQPILILMGVACGIIQYLWASREEL